MSIFKLLDRIDIDAQGSSNKKIQLCDIYDSE